MLLCAYTPSCSYTAQKYLTQILSKILILLTGKIIYPCQKVVCSPVEIPIPRKENGPCLREIGTDAAVISDRYEIHGTACFGH